MSVFSSHLSTLRSYYSSPSTCVPESFSSSLPSFLSSCKLELAKEGLIPPFTPSICASPSFSSSACSAREFFELACFASICNRDLLSFSRHFAQLRAFYFDYSSLLPPSSYQSELLGLHLLSLIAQNRVSEFHSELELIAHQHAEDEALSSSSSLQLKRSISSSNAVLSSESIQFPINIEQQLMEGAYNQVLNSRSTSPSPRFGYFLSLLANAVREKVTKCIADAFNQYSLNALHQLLQSSSLRETEAFCHSHGWLIADGMVKFHSGNKENSQESKGALVGQNYQTIEQTLKFATELERIV
jgi:26S proteasome regulatory subunit N12